MRNRALLTEKCGKWWERQECWAWTRPRRWVDMEQISSLHRLSTKNSTYIYTLDRYPSICYSNETSYRNSEYIIDVLSQICLSYINIDRPTNWRIIGVKMDDFLPNCSISVLSAFMTFDLRVRGKFESSFLDKHKFCRTKTPPSPISVVQPKWRACLHSAWKWCKIVYYVPK